MAATRHESRAVRFWCASVAAIGAGALVLAGGMSHGTLVRRIPLLAFFWLEVAILQVIPVRLTWDDEGEDLALDEAFFVPMSILLTPFATALALGLAMAVGQVYKRSPPLKALFNIGQTLTSAALGLAVVGAIRGHAPTTAPRAILAAATGGLVYALASAVAVALIIAAAQRIPVVRALSEGTRLRVATWGGSISFGVLVLVATARYPSAVFLSPAPIIALQVGYSSAVVQGRERRRVEELYAAMSSMRSGMDVPQILERLSSSAIGLLDARSAQVVDPSTAPPTGALRTDVGTGTVLDVVRPPTGNPWSRRDRQLARTIAEVAESAVEKAQLFEDVKRQTLYDALTGLPNQVLFEDRVVHAITQAARAGTEAAVACVDMDNIKRINESLGHAAGNELLVAAGQRLTEVVRASDTVARMSGDEFVLLMPSTGAVDAASVGEKLVDAFSEPFDVAGHRVYCGASVGIALFPLHATAYASLLQRSALALFEAKARGRGSWCLYTPSMGAVTDARINLEAELRNALDTEELRVFFQPQVSLSSGRLIGAEVLVRWQHPTQGLLGPGEFVPLAEELGLIHVIDRWVLRAACAQMRSWRKAGLPPIRISVNLSGAELAHRGLVDGILADIGDHDVPTSQIELEVTETVAAQEGPDVHEVLQRLRDSGVGVAIDDFGTGHSTLARLGSFPIDVLKIDKSFIDEIGDGQPGDAPLVLAVLAMAQSLNLQVVAEGVERVEQLCFLRDHGCDRAQGYLVGRPAPAAQLERLLIRGQAD